MKTNKKWLYSVLLLIASLLTLEKTYGQTTLTAVPNTTWSCGNEVISPSTYTFLASQQSTFRSNQPGAPASGTWVIPVVVHVLFDAAHANDPAFNITYQQIQWQISQLNKGFQNMINPANYVGVNTSIQFCLAQTSMGPSWTNNNERGVMRYQVPSATLSNTMNLAGQNTLLGVTHSSAANFPFQNYLNIWLVNEIVDVSGPTPNTNVIGFSNFPNTLTATNVLDGVVIRHDVFGSNVIPNHQNILMAQLDQGNILCHEVGHYLNMLHTFEPGICSGGTNATCLTQGDMICDTPPSNVTNVPCTTTNTCTDALAAYGNVDQADHLANFMSYADDDCMMGFTNDQSLLMQGVLNTAWPTGRMDMVSATNLAATGLTGAGANCCPTGVTTAFFQSTVSSCSAATFTCIVPTCAMNQTYAWDFGDGNTATVSTNTITHTYSLAGTYIPTLTVTGSNGSVDVYSQQIQIGTYAQSSAQEVCNNTNQGVYFHVTGASGTYTVDLNLAGVHTTRTYSINPALQSIYHHPGSEDIEFNIPINLPLASLPAQTNYTITLNGANTCSLSYVNTFSVVNCCNNIITNGDFNNGYTGWTHFNNGYIGQGPGVAWSYTPSCHFDSPICGVPSTCTAIQMLNQTVSLQGGTTYHVNYEIFGGNPSTLKINQTYLFMDTLFIGTRMLDNSGNVIHDFGVVPVMDLVSGSWHHYDFEFTNPTTISNAHLSISQVKNFYSPESVSLYGFGGYGWGYDYSIDEISLRAVAPVFTVAVTPSVSTICPSQTLTLTSSAASSYTWSTTANTNTISVSPITTTVYSVTATSALNCTATAQSTVNVIPTVSITASSQTICSGNSSTLTAVSPNSTFTWSPGAAHTVSISITPTVSTIYTVAATNTISGCVSTRTINITVNATPTVAVSNATICSGKSATLTASGATTYSWSNNANTASTVVSPTVTTNYTVTGTTAGCSNTKTLSVTVNPSPTVTATANPTLICAGLSVTLTAGGGATSYSWSAGGSTATISVSPTITTVYTVTGTTGSCSTSKNVTVTVIPNAPVMTASNLTPILCSGGSASLTASGANTYTWMPGSITTATAIVTPTALTVYTVSGEYAMAGCGIGSATVVVNANTSTLCCSAPNTIIGTSLTSSVNIAAGNYTVSGTVIDMQGTITFTGNTSFTGYTLRMAPRTKLIVPADYSLTLTNCKVFSCSELWDGIYFTENTTKIGNFTSTNTSIEDMYNGIVMDCNNITIPTGAAVLGHITIDQSILNKNYVSIQLKNGSGVNGGAPYNLAITSSTISSNTSTTSPGSTLKPSNTYTYAYNQITNGTMGASPPYISFPRAFIGIYLSRLGTTSDVKIGDNSSSSYTNTFDNMDFGIYGADAQIKVKNNYFRNITGSFMSEDIGHGGGYRATGPVEIGIAVMVDHGTGNTYDLTVGSGTVLSTSNPYPLGNKFEDCNKGIKSNNAATTYVSGNIFTSASTDIPVITTSGSPPTQVNNPNTYYYYKAQNAAWYTSFEGSARFYWNYVRNHNVGVYAAVSNGTVQINVENNDIAAPSSTGYCKNAVQLIQTAGAIGQASVLNNTITNVYNGLTASNLLTGLQITTNTISIETTAKTYNHSATTRRTGITLNYCEYANVQGNNISGNGSVPTSTTTAQYLNGVYLLNSISGKIECNSTTSLGRDFVFEGTCNNRWLVNDMSNSYTGLEVRVNGIIGSQGALTYTGTPNLSANTWTTITRQTNVVSSPSVNVTSKLFLLSGATTQPTLNFSQGGSSVYSNTLGGINVTTGTSYTCLGGYSAQRLGNTSGNGKTQRSMENEDSLTVYTMLATNDLTDYAAFPNEFVHHNRQMVYNLIKQDSISPIDSSALDRFYVSNQNSVFDKLSQVRALITANEISNAIAVNNSIATTDIIERKYQRANELLLKRLNDRAYQFTSIEYQDLVDLANECLVKGSYVMQCRNVIALIGNQEFTYDENCDREASNSRGAKPIIDSDLSNVSFALFPNPNNGAMQLDYNLGNDSKAIMRLYDITGKLIRSYNLENTKGTLQINEQNLHNGIYFYRILVGDKIIKTDKIVVIK